MSDVCISSLLRMLLVPPVLVMPAPHRNGNVLRQCGTWVVLPALSSRGTASVCLSCVPISWGKRSVYRSFGRRKRCVCNLKGGDTCTERRDSQAILRSS